MRGRDLAQVLGRLTNVLKGHGILAGKSQLHSEWRLIGLTICFGLACGVYIWLPYEIPGVTFFLPLTIVVGIVCTMRRAWRNSAVLCLMMVLLGLLMASIRVATVAAPRFTVERFVSLEGTVESYDVRPDKAPRMILAPSTINDKKEGLPVYVRLIVRTKATKPIAAGDFVSLKAILTPPSGPVVPGGFDFARRAFFGSIGAEGFAASTITVHDRPEGDLVPLGHIGETRRRVMNEIVEVLPEQAGGVAVALIVGYRHLIDKQTATAIRDAGLAHLLAISGLHMGLITAAAFFVFEYMFAAVPAIALRVRPKKIAAVLAWCIALSYLMLSGMGVATVRAFIMISVALLAVLVDRRVLSLRSIALAALIILFIWPETILSVSFQMSFAATAALVAVYEWISRYDWIRPRREVGFTGRVIRYVGFMAFTSLISQVAIAPFALYHFQTLSIIGILANVIVVPIMSLIVMPIALLSVVLMAFGLHHWPLVVLGWGIEFVIDLSHYFASMPYAVFRSGAPSDGFLLVTSVLFVSLLIIRNARIVGIVSIFFLVSIAAPYGEVADVLIDNGGRVVARQDQSSGRLLIVGGRRDGFRDESWRRYWGLDPDRDVGVLHRHCDPDACRTALGQERYVTVLKSMSGLRKACDQGDVVIGSWRWRRYCRGSVLYITFEEMEASSPLALFNIKNGDIRAEFSTPDGTRPWHFTPRR